MQPVVPSTSQILHLYRKYLITASSFSSYNFRTYFLRRSRDIFRTALLPQSQAAPSSLFSKQGSATAKVSPSTLRAHDASFTLTEKDKLAQFYQKALEDLKVLQRSAITNRLYEGEKLVVERPSLIVAGARAEASLGGGGQPNSGPQSSGGAPPNGSR